VIENTPLLPAWLTIPVGAVVMVILAGHLLALHVARMPPKRRRIRIVSNALMMLVAPLLSYALGIVTPAQSRLYVLVWVVIAAMLFMIILLALLDLTHTMRLHREQLRELRQKIAAARAEAAAEVRAKRP
jgi:uncharacterized membrane protein